MTSDLLIVDPDPARRAGLLDRLGGTVPWREAATGRAGLEEVRRRRPEALLLATYLPDMDLAAFLHALREPQEDLAVAVVLLADPADEAAVVTGLREGAGDHVDPARIDGAGLRCAIRVAQDRLEMRRAQATALRENEANLRRREAELARAHRVGRSGGHEVDLRGPPFRSRRSPEYLALHGLPPEAWNESHEDWLSRVHPDDRERTERAFLDALTGSEDEYRVEYRIVRPSDGATRWISVLAEIERDAEGKPLRLFGTHTDVTDRKLDEERLRLALEAVNGIVYDWDIPSGQVLRSGQVQEITGFDPAGMPAEASWWHERTHPEDLPRLAAEARAAFEAGAERLEAEYRFRHRDGRWLQLADRALILRGPEGPVRLIGSTVDVTARRHAMAALRDSESRYRAIFENAAVGVGRVSLSDMRCLDVNDALCAMLGYTREELLAQPWSRITHPDDVERDLSQFRRMSVGEIDRYDVEKRYLRKDGRVVWARLAVSLVRDAEGRPDFEIAVVEDITDQKISETARRQSEERFRRVIETNILAFGIGDPDGRVTYVNEAFLQLVGHSRAEFEAGLLDWRALTPPEHRALDDGKMAELRRSGTAAPYEKEYVLRDGRRVPILVALTLADPEDEEHVAVIVDLSAQKAAEAALARANEALEATVADRTRELTETARELAAEMRRREKAQADLLQAQKLEALGQLTGGIAHDFNNVLAAVLGTCRLIARRTQDPDVRDLVRHGEAAAERGSALVRQLTAFARRSQLAPIRLDPASALPRIEPLIGQALGAGIACEISVEDGVWPVQVDSHALEIALVHLAANARDAMPGGGRLRILARNEVGSGGEPDGVAFVVQDTGTGMEPEVLARAVEPFFTTKGPGEGPGLGLAMVHGFAEQSGGRLRLDSRLGEGTTVTIWLPRAPGFAAPAAPAEAGSHGNAGLLLVDDDPALRAVTAAHLRDLGYRVAEASGGEEALSVAQGAHAPDLVVTDVVMPGMDGVALAARLRAERPDLPILFMTGHAGTRALAGEVVLRKPFSEDELSRRILQMLGRVPVEGEAVPAAPG
ncbi:PAS domain-containing protein [Rubellimicrobium roseum]|uniref:histidine kinase n=1 Tax=Rubellimicrobium roseum TaxID=687525 RepID=A0A5C4NB77_9RHOB|nr:PAS domain-containing protein [Rubellimicrobium roseum]TNC70891.1 PAS domain S-box protein [Rubellimicrobium roseum]